MNRILLYPEERQPGAAERYAVTGVRARHVRELLRGHVGDTLRVGLLNGSIGLAEILALDEARALLECRFESEPPRPDVDLILAVPRPKSLKKLLPDVAALGVRRLVLLRTWRVERAYLESRVLSPEVYRPLLHEGLMQSGTTAEPEVHIERRFRPFIEDRAPGLYAGHARLVAHPYAERGLAGGRLPEGVPVALAVGPEGGFLPEEIAHFERAGFSPVTLGPRILRVETACVALLAQIALLRGGG